MNLTTTPAAMLVGGSSRPAPSGGVTNAGYVWTGWCWHYVGRTQP